MRDLFSLKLYTRVARLGSFSAAARECGLSQSQASRIIADLEAELGARLLSRTTRAVVPTETGIDFLARVEPILAALDEAEHSVREGGELRGLLRMSMPTSFGIKDAIPRLSSFVARHPKLSLQFLLEDRRQDLVRDAVDVAIRLGRLVDSTATAKQIATIPRVIVASPDYLAVHGAPQTPQELLRHRIVGGTATSVPSAWLFARDGEDALIQLEPYFSTNENEGAISAAAAGYGITSTSGWGMSTRAGRGIAGAVTHRLVYGGDPGLRVLSNGESYSRVRARRCRSPDIWISARTRSFPAVGKHALRSIGRIEIGNLLSASKACALLTRLVRRIACTKFRFAPTRK
jgi:DNA-binding transcriptional LysR family regulator